MNFDNDLMLFFRTIYEDSADMDECSAKVKSAVAAVADKLDIVRAELAVKMPATKLCEDGADMLMVLYDREKDVENEPFEASFPLFEGGFITVTFYSGNSNGFDNEQRNIVEIIANTVFIQFNRVVMQELVTHVIKTDIETGAATLDALINYAGMLIAQNRIEDFSIIFFNIHNFKYVNKVLNYEQGDVVLRNYTKTIYRNLSDGEMIARLGGDNFVMLVKNESLREYIDMLSFMNIRYDDGKVSKDFIFSATIGYSSTVGIRYPREVMARASIAYAAARRVGAGHVKCHHCQHQRRRRKILGRFLGEGRAAFVLRPDRVHLVRGGAGRKELPHAAGAHQRIGGQRGRRGISVARGYSVRQAGEGAPGPLRCEAVPQIQIGCRQDLEIHPD